MKSGSRLEKRKQGRTESSLVRHRYRAVLYHEGLEARSLVARIIFVTSVLRKEDSTCVSCANKLCAFETKLTEEDHRELQRLGDTAERTILC